MTRLLLPAAARAVVERAARQAYPREGCGVLIGVVEGEVVRVDRALATANVSRAPEQRFRIDDQVLLEAHRGARQEGLEVVGYFHSHPDGPAAPSALDRERAHPGASYLIVSVVAGRAERVASWRLRDDGGGFEEESIESQA